MTTITIDTFKRAAIDYGKAVLTGAKADADQKSGMPDIMIGAAYLVHNGAKPDDVAAAFANGFTAGAKGTNEKTLKSRKSDVTGAATIGTLKYGNRSGYDVFNVAYTALATFDGNKRDALKKASAYLRNDVAKDAPVDDTVLLTAMEGVDATPGDLLGRSRSAVLAALEAAIRAGVTVPAAFCTMVETVINLDDTRALGAKRGDKAKTGKGKLNAAALLAAARK